MPAPSIRPTSISRTGQAYFDDQLGGLALTIDGLRRRDTLVIKPAAARRIPIMSALAGGYARHLDDTINIQANTAKVMAEVAEESAR